MGIGDWGLGIGDWGLGPIPNPQSPFQKTLNILKSIFIKIIFIKIKLLNKREHFRIKQIKFFLFFHKFPRFHFINITDFIIFLTNEFLTNANRNNN